MVNGIILYCQQNELPRTKGRGISWQRVLLARRKWRGMYPERFNMQMLVSSTALFQFQITRDGVGFALPCCVRCPRPVFVSRTIGQWNQTPRTIKTLVMAKGGF
jgi:hypothetical protein